MANINPKNNNSPNPGSTKYTMRISRQTVDKLGVKMYDRVSAVVAELVANSYDADATRVVVSLPAGQWLARKVEGSIIPTLGLTAEVVDNGIGMTTEEVNDFFLFIGGERRADSRRGDRSKTYKRLVMGRKGVGKLAPFGICRRIEVWTAGGEPVTENGITGYRQSNFIMQLETIMKDTNENYHPQPGADDNKLVEAHGTRIVMSEFGRRHVPTLKDLERQMAQRFGITSANWQVTLRDNANSDAEDLAVGAFPIPTMPDTRLTFAAPHGTSSRPVGALPDEADLEPVLDEADEVVSGIMAGFEHDGRIYPIEGWVGYAKNNYKDDLMAGVRIYCRGKIAAQTNLFDKKSGFTGEFQVRAYLVGEIHVDWLDEEEDLIQTDRKDILWSDELGQELERWGQRIVGIVGTTSLKPVRREILEKFENQTRFAHRINRAFPGDNQKEIRENARELGEMFAQRMRPEEVTEGSIEETVNIVLMLAPHVTLDHQLQAAANAIDSQFGMVSEILKTAHIAELSSFGRIAKKRVEIIDKLYHLKEASSVTEAQLLDLVEEAPWLVDPEWAPVTTNKNLAAVREQFEKFLKSDLGQQIHLAGHAGRRAGTRADFILLEEDSAIHLVTIRKPKTLITDDDVDVLSDYLFLLKSFVEAPENELILRRYNRNYRITVVCDGLELDRKNTQLFESWQDKKQVAVYNWAAFLDKTDLVHQDFIAEAERQQLFVAESMVTSAELLIEAKGPAELPTVSKEVAER